jgi:hypothetical protein
MPATNAQNAKSAIFAESKMTPIRLKQVIHCLGATVRNDELQPISDPVLMLSLKAQDEQIYLLPLSEQGAARIWELISYWRQARDLLSEQESPKPTKLQ